MKRLLAKNMGVKSVKEKILWVFRLLAQIHLRLISFMFLFGAIYFIVGIIMADKFNSNALWVRAGEAVLRLHASLLIGMVHGNLVGLLLYGPLFVASIIKYGVRSRRFPGLIEVFSVGFMTRGVPSIIGGIVMFFVTFIRYFQVPCPELFRYSYIILDWWLGVAYYPKPSIIAALVAMAIPKIYTYSVRYRMYYERYIMQMEDDIQQKLSALFHRTKP